MHLCFVVLVIIFENFIVLGNDIVTFICTEHGFNAVHIDQCGDTVQADDSVAELKF